MTHLVIKATAIAMAASALAACETTPTYPTHAGYTPPAPVKPKYPTGSEAPPMPAPQPAPVETAPPPASSPPPPPAVESQALAPVASPTTPPPPPPEPTPAAPQPQASYSPPPVHYREVPARLIADGRVVSAKGMYRDYEVQKGDHVDAIARDLQTTRRELVEANHLKEPYSLRPGRHLKVPVAKAYVVSQGDTVAAVARRFGVSPSELADLNAISVRGRLAAGEKLALPANYQDHGPTRVKETEVAERPAEYRPAYSRPARPQTEETTGGPYVPSPAALAAAAARRSEVASQPPAPAYAAAAGLSSSHPVTASDPSTAAQRGAIEAAGRGRFMWPVRGEIIAPFGVMGVGRRNDGVDIRSVQGTVVHAAAAGEVVYAGNQVPGFGNLVLVKHADGWVTAYAHLDATTVKMRDTVAMGQQLGLVGSTGGVVGPQLHFEVRYAPTPTEKARPVDPLLVLPK
jgi:murein DD-endopeptidase MepM/ murein hydrolase activator NlpD